MGTEEEDTSQVQTSIQVVFLADKQIIRCIHTFTLVGDVSRPLSPLFAWQSVRSPQFMECPLGAPLSTYISSADFVTPLFAPASKK